MDGKPLEVHNTPFTPLPRESAAADFKGNLASDHPDRAQRGALTRAQGAGPEASRRNSRVVRCGPSSKDLRGVLVLGEVVVCTVGLHRQHRRRCTLVKDAARLVSDSRRHRCVGAYHELC